jgi:dihydrofolate reductase
MSYTRCHILFKKTIFTPAFTGFYLFVMVLSAIAAVSLNNVIGKHNALPWHMPADMRFFKTTTMGHAVIMGRKTYQSFKKALRGRTNFVITRQKDFTLPDAFVVHSLSEAIKKAAETEKEEIFILGGAEVYRESLPLLDRIYLTRIYAEVEGDAFFPPLDPGEWKLVTEDVHQPDEKNRYAYSFQLWERQGDR